MKRCIIALLLAAVLCLTGCQAGQIPFMQSAAPAEDAAEPAGTVPPAEQTPEPELVPDPWPTPRQIADAVADTQKSLPDMTAYGPLTPDAEALLQRVYSIDPAQVEDWCIRKAEGKDADEIAVFRAVDAQAAKEIKDLLDTYGARREMSLTGYVPDAARMVSERIVASAGPMAVLVIVHSRSAATELLASVLEGGVLPETEQADAQAALEALEAPAAAAAEGTYDHDSVMLAWSQGSPDGLDALNAQVYMAAFNIIQTVAAEGTPWEKENAIHNWMVTNIDYDTGAVGSWWWKDEPQEHADTPYGALINHVAVCSGYAETFQLFMDMLGIPCMTVYGASGTDENEHIWNLVQLDGQWYHTDVTWDDPVGQRPVTAYLNQTDAYMREHGPHIWNAGAYPASADTQYVPTVR